MENSLSLVQLASMCIVWLIIYLLNNGKVYINHRGKTTPFMGNTSGWCKPERSSDAYRMSLYRSAENSTESCPSSHSLCPTRHTQPLTWPYTVRESDGWAFLRDLCQIAITLAANHTRDPRVCPLKGVFVSHVCVISKYIFFWQTHWNKAAFFISMKFFNGQNPHNVFI